MILFYENKMYLNSSFLYVIKEIRYFEKRNMMWKKQNILFLIPPSEGKKMGWKWSSESLSFTFIKPLDISLHASEKDLKCKGNRYEEAMNLNRSIWEWPYMEAIERYSGSMYSAIDYEHMTSKAKSFFRENFIVLSGMYGMVKPSDMIGNYKLPIEARWLYNFWGSSITETLQNMRPRYIVDLLPLSYKKLIHWNTIDTQIVRVDFLSISNPSWEETKQKYKKMTHWVKKVKWKWIKEICEKEIKNYSDFWWMIEKEWNQIFCNIIS